jgi:hypothetical protein
VKPYILSDPPSIRIAQNGFPPNDLSPTPAPSLRTNHVELAAAETINGLEDRIAHLEACHTQISLELDITRETLCCECSNRRDSVLSDKPRSPKAHDTFSRDDTMRFLKANHAKNAALSRSLDQHTQLNKSLVSDLQMEHLSRGAFEEEIRCRKALNTAFTGQDRTVSPQGFPDVGTISYCENTLYLLRKDLASIHDDLYDTRRKLATSDNQCDTLKKKVSSLQRSITICVDEAAKALDVERELRSEIQARLQDILEVNEGLRNKWSANDTLTDTELLTEPWNGGHGVQRVEERTAVVSQSSLSQEYPAKESGRDFEEIPQAQQLRKRIALLAEEVERYKAREVDLGMAQRELLIDVQMKSSAFQVGLFIL